MTSSFPGCFVTGTDTEVGKTCVSTALLHLLTQAGWRVGGFKPVAAGMQGQINEDVAALQRASPLDLQLNEIGPYQYRSSCAPHLAALQENRPISRPHLLAAARHLQQRCDFIVAEGAGGLCVPLGPGWGLDDLMCDLQWPVVLVVGLRLGCLNHAVLTARALHALGLRCVGWVGNTVDPHMLELQGNVQTLQALLLESYGISCWGIVPRLNTPSPQQVAAHLAQSAILTTLR